MIDQKIANRWKIGRPKGARADRLKVPKWVQQRQLLIGGYAEQGWSAFDQTDYGTMVATGEWGDELAELEDGNIICTQYPLGYPNHKANRLSAEQQQARIDELEAAIGAARMEIANECIIWADCILHTAISSKPST